MPTSARLTLALAVCVSSLAFAGQATDAHLAQVKHAQVVIVRGSADHMEHVMQKAGANYVVVSPDELPSLPLHSRQVLMVNCRGEMSDAARDRVRRFVAAGGFLYTTDHAVYEVIEKTFPNTLAWTRQTTNEEIVPIKVHGTDKDRGLLNSLGGNAKEFWQLAGGGYLFKILNPRAVDVLMESPEVAKRFGKQSSALGVRVRYQDGQIIHVSGHFYTQPGQSGLMANAAKTFETISANVVEAKKNDGARLDRLYSSQAKREVTLKAAPAPTSAPVAPSSVTQQSMESGRKLRVLENQGGYSKVRDEEGNEGWVESDAL